MKSLATWCVRHRVIVLLLWLAALIGMTVISQSVGTAYSNSFTLPNTESTQALDLLQAAAPSVAGDREQIVFHTTDGAKVTDPEVQASVDDHAGQGEGGAPRHHRSPAPTSPYGAAQISKDGTTGVRHRHLRQAGPVHLDPGGQAVRVDRPDAQRARTSRWRWPARWPRRPTSSPSAAPGSG